MADAGLSVNCDPKAVVEVAASDLVGPGTIVCPNARMPLWSNHPRVFLDVASTGKGRCPYCGTVYQLKAGAVLPAVH